MSSDYLELRNWGKYQHYGNRRPPWIKLQILIFDPVENPDMSALGTPARYLAIMLMILAAETGNNIPSGIAWLSVETKMSYTATRKALAELRAIDFIRDADWDGEEKVLANRQNLLAPPAREEFRSTEGSLLRKLPWASKRPTDEVWEVLAELFGPVKSGTSAHGKRNKAVRDLKRLDATPESIRMARHRWDRKFEGATPTDMAIATHYPTLMHGVNVAPVPPCPECEMGGGMHAADCPEIGGVC